MASTVTVNIVGDANSLKRALGDAESSMTAFGNRAKAVGDRATSIGRSMTIGITLPLIGLGKVAFDELQQSAAASAQTAAAIKSTGGAANVTARQVDELATSLLKKTGIDDESIKSGANLLLTFKNIHNEAGKGEDIFTQATKAALDLSVAFGKDLPSSAILVGKALNDPIAGISALTRVGVTFTAQQKETIKALVESGDVIGAQKVILRELSDEVGGSGKAFGDSFAGQISKAKEELMNAGAAILTAFIPALKSIASVALDVSKAFLSLPPMVQQVVIGGAALLAAYGPVAYMFGALAKGVSGVVSIFGALQSASQTVALKLLYAGDAMAAIGLGSVAAVAALASVVAAFVVAAAAIGYPLHLLLGQGGFGGLLDALTKAKSTGQNWAAAIIAGAKASTAPLDEMRARIDTLRTSRDALQKQVESGRLSEGEAIAQFVKYNAAIDGVKKGLAGYKQQQKEAAEAEAARKQELQNLANGTTNLASATDEAKNAINEMQSAVLAALGGPLALQQANLAMADAQTKLNEAIASGDPAAITAATLDLEQARLGVAGATLQAQSAEQQLLDVVHQGPEAVQAEINRLKEAQTTYGDTSGKIQEAIDKLFWLNLSINGLPTDHNTNITLAGVEKALNDAYVLDQFLSSLNGRQVTVDMVINRTGAGWEFIGNQ